MFLVPNCETSILDGSLYLFYMLEVTCFKTDADETSCNGQIGIAALMMYAYDIAAQLCYDA